MLAIDIVINAGAGLAANADALAAFERAAQAWEARINDSITVTIDADLSNLGSPNVIGQTSSVLLQAGYDTIRNQMIADAADEPDDAIVASLPTAASAAFSLPVGFSLNGSVIGSKAVLKATGFAGLDVQFGASDAEITFNSQFQFDYDNSNGVTGGTMDFETVAIHEIGHALGFISSVDTVDYYTSVNFRTAVSPSMLDLFRFENNTANDPSDANSFNAAARSLMPGGDAITDDITGAGNAAAENRMSTGSYTGDGRQASHYKDNLFIGVMDPTLAYGEVVPISDADLRALDLIGYEISLGPVANSPPVANNDTAAINKKTGKATGNVLANDTDANGDPLTATVVTGPTKGTLIFDENNGSFTYTPGASFSGTDTFTYVANDGTANSNIATVTIGATGGGPGGGKGGGKPTGVRMTSASLAFATASFSIHQLPAGMEGDLDMNAAGETAAAAESAIVYVPSAANSAGTRSDSETQSEDAIAGTQPAAKPSHAVLVPQTMLAEDAWRALYSASKRSDADDVDDFMAGLDDMLTVPFWADIQP